MKEMCRKTITFPNKRGIFIPEECIGGHAGAFEYRGHGNPIFLPRIEGLGHLNWLAELMALVAEDGRSYYECIGVATMTAPINDTLSHASLPVIFEDLIECRQYAWGRNEARLQVLTDSFYRGAEAYGVAITGGETAAQRYQVQAYPPIEDAPLFSGNAIGIVNPPSRYISGKALQEGDVILGARSTGMHINGASAVIRKALEKPEILLDPLPNGMTFGEALLVDPACYLDLVEALLNAGVKIHAMLAGSGGGVSKVAYDKRNFLYAIEEWPELLPVFQHMLTIGIPLHDCLKTFNWGIGWFVFLPEREADKAVGVSKSTPTPLTYLGYVTEGMRSVDFRPERIRLDPPEA
ncbi:MAG: hypothetical protein HY001_01470 [Candidatus Portnoybacteria bacterium]|nr:hypothetical protein [Candidatus Portnoybacteria bacterium]